MKIGAQPKRVALLAILAAIEAWLMFTDRSPPPAVPAPPRTAPRKIPAVAAAPQPLALSLIDRLLRVSPAGTRNLFEFVEPRVRPRAAPAPVQDAETAASSAPAATSPATRPVELLTFYGYAARPHRPLRGFFSAGDDIYNGSEGDLIAGLIGPRGRAGRPAPHVRCRLEG
jgi:hypothetical protein